MVFITFPVEGLTRGSRAYALQRQHPISFTGRPLDIIRAADEIRNATQRLVSGIIVHTEKDAAGMMGLALLMEIFDAIDEDILICWNARCNVSTKHGDGECHILTEAKALSIYQNLARVSDASRYRGGGRNSDRFEPEFLDESRRYSGDDNNNNDQTTSTNTPQRVSSRGNGEGEDREDINNEARILRDFVFLSETQCADILVTQKWVQDRLWNLCFSHGLLSSQPKPLHPGLSFGYAQKNAEKALRLCRLLRISALEAHGVGIVSILLRYYMYAFH